MRTRTRVIIVVTGLLAAALAVPVANAADSAVGPPQSADCARMLKDRARLAAAGMTKAVCFADPVPARA